MPAPETVIVVPCYNEAGRIQVEEFRRFLAESAVSFVFVDDGSTDKTEDVLHSICAGFGDCAQVVAVKPNGGKAEAVRRGVLAAFERNPSFVGYWDADLATPLDAIRELKAIFDERPAIDMVFGCRVKLLGRQVERQTVRHYLGRIFATAASAVLRIPIYDTQCGAKIFRVNADTRSLFAQPFGSRWVFDVELIARYIARVGSAREAALRIYEFPLRVWTDVAGSKVRPRHFLIAFGDLVKIQLRYGRLIR